MDQSFVDRLEAVTQELHSAKQEISVLHSNVAHLSEENEDLQRELSSLTANEKEDKIRLKSVSGTCQLSEDKVTDLTEQLQLALKAKERAESLADELACEVSSKNQSGKQSSIMCMCGPEMSVLEEKLAQFEKEKDQKKTQLADAVSDLHKALEKSTNMKSEMDELNEELECLQSQMSSQNNIIQCQREELDGLRSQAEATVSTSFMDTNRKGNSLFSEVEDRRVKAETKMVQVLSQAEKVESRLRKEQKENTRLKNQISLLMRNASNSASEKTVRCLEQELEDSKQQVLKLTQELHQSQKNKRQSTEPSVPSSLPQSDKPTPLVTYLKATISQLQIESEEQRKAKDQLQIQNIQLDFLWTQKKNESRSLKKEKDRLTTLNSHLTTVIDGLKNDSDSNEDISQQKEMITIPMTTSDPSQVNLLPEATKTTTTTKTLSAKDASIELLGLDHQSAIATDGSNSNKDNSAYKDLRSFILGPKSKSVAFAAEDKSVLTEIDNLSASEGKPDKDGDGCGGAGGKGGKSRKRGCGGDDGGSSRGKYKNVTHVNMKEVKQEEGAPECAQQ